MKNFKITNSSIAIAMFTLSFSLEVQAQNKDYLPVYSDGDTNVLWQPSGWMPAGEGISINLSFKDSNNICIKVGFAPKKEPQRWVGIYWLPGSWEGPGINVYEFLGVKKDARVKLTFRAKGEEGGERVQFKVGGVTTGNDSIEFAVSTSYKALSQSWESMEIDLSNEDLSNVVGGFCVVTSLAQNPKSSIVKFFLDDIKFEVIK